MKDTSIRYLKGVGPRKEAIFNRLGVYTVKDLLYYFPFRYQDRRTFTKIKDLRVNEFAVIKGKVVARNLRKLPYFIHSKKVRSIFEIILDDGTAKMHCTWFNQAYLSEIIPKKAELIVYGKLSLSKKGRQMISPEYELFKKSDSLNLGKIVGVYRSPSEFNQKFMRKLIAISLKTYCLNYPDPLPFYIRREKNIPNIAKSLEEIHFPSSWQNAENARQRFIFEELFFSQILVYLRKAKHRLQKGLKCKATPEVLNVIRKNLPFQLTQSQEEVLLQILRDLEKSSPMHRLLQGDVGCGKTVVAAFVIAVCANCGYQVAFMVPTEVLTYQHQDTLKRLFKGLEFLEKNPQGAIRVISSSLPKKELASIYKDLENGTIKVIIGTHSLIQEKIKFKRLGLVVIDEQHKFGVAQRALLPKKSTFAPHYLVMSATPIPRSLALSLYGDLDLSVIRHLPKARKAPHTIWVKQNKRKWVYEFLERHLEKGRQAYIIYPVIEESQDEDLQSIRAMQERIAERFKKYSVGIFHSRLKSQEKLKVIKSFRENKINILVSTTVVEVGLDIENATLMVVENPERFGLAQLHQLRGRIRRSGFQPYFILISRDTLSETSRRRLEVISRQVDGFKIAEEDLLLRGPGDFFGNLQHGFPDLKIANPLRDLEILAQARNLAYKVIKSDPHLEKREHKCIRDHLFQ